jgi:deoxyadenosine/deoxycytidine kinase
MLIAIVGNIATGKTTLAKLLCSSCSEAILVEEIRSEFLADLYQKSGFFFQNQIHYYLQCLDAALYASSGSLVIQDRCILDMHDIFSCQLHDIGLIDDKEIRLLESLKLKINQISPVSRYIYMRSDPETSLHRVRLRGLGEEENVSLSLLQDLEKRYEEWCKTVLGAQDLFIDSTNTSIPEALEIAMSWLNEENNLG